MNRRGVEPVVELKRLTRSFQQGGVKIDVLCGVDLAIMPGEIVALLGPSGSGKSTLLQAVGLLEGGFGGEIVIGGQSAEKSDSRARTVLRREHLGFVYQFHHLLAEFTAVENAALPLIIRGQSKKVAEQRAMQILERVGMKARADHKPGELSGGERQRVAIARALVTDPSLVLMDEPTGNLDQTTAASILALMDELAKESACAFVIVTHDVGLASHQDRVMKLDGGRLVAQA